MSNSINKSHVVLTNVRLSYVHLTEPYASQPGADEKYSAMVLVPKDNAANTKKIETAIAATTAKAREKYGKGFPDKPKTSVHDGDGTRPSDGMPYADECQQHWVFTASNKRQPTIVDRALQPILDSTEIYSGMYANVGITFFPYNTANNKGIGIALDNVQKIRDGEPLGGMRVSAEDDFAGLIEENEPAAVDPITGEPLYS